MAEKVPSFKNGGAFWFTDLTTPDAMYIFPVLTAVTFLITVEFNMKEVMDHSPAVLKCDNKAALSIATNPVLHERTKNVEVDKHFVRDKVQAGEILPTSVSSTEQLADILTKVLPIAQHEDLLSKTFIQASLKLRKWMRG